VFEEDAPPLEIIPTSEAFRVEFKEESKASAAEAINVESSTYTPVLSIAGVAKVVSRPDEMMKSGSIEEADNPRVPSNSNVHIQHLRSTKKIHVKHRFEDKDEEDYTSCKFICHTFWATQFHALRALYLEDDSDEGIHT
jgi:hypothetical protein